MNCRIMIAAAFLCCGSALFAQSSMIEKERGGYKGFELAKPSDFDETPEIKDKAVFTETEEVNGKDFMVYKTLAEDGDSIAMRKLALCYLNGLGVAKDRVEAWKWFGNAARLGDVESEYNIGVLYRDGIGVLPNFKESAYWFRKAASHGHPEALVNIARQFEEGKGVLQDSRIAAENYWRAAERGNAEGAYCYAMMLKNGKGVKRDLKRAEKYFGQAAQSNYKDAAAQLLQLQENR